MLLDSLLLWTLSFAVCCSGVCHGLHFYMRSGEVKCFYESLAKDTLLIGDVDAYVEKEGLYVEDDGIRLTITVDETFDDDHRVLNQKNSHSGDFTFTALDTGEHRVCICPHYPRSNAKLRVFVDFDIRHIDALDSKRSSEVNSLRDRVNQLNKRLYAIRNEQNVIREKEALFRDQSESANAKIVLWAILQLIVLVAACIFQLKYLKNFFVKQKVL